MKLRGFYSKRKDSRGGGALDKILSNLRTVKTKYQQKIEERELSELVSEFDDASGIIKSDILFISTSNLVDKDGASIEMVDIIRHYESLGRHVNVIQPIYASNLPIKQDYHDTHLPLIFHTPIPLDKEEKQELQEFLNWLNTELEPDYLQMYDEYELLLGQIKYRMTQLELLIEETGCRYVICRSLYTNPWVIMAATNMGVKCIEMQHGVMTESTVYYQSPVAPDQLGKDTLLMPDYILTLGEEWSKILMRQNYIYNSSNTFVLGTTLYDDALSSASCQEDIPDADFKVLIATQPYLFSIKDWLDEFLSSYAESLVEAGIKIVFRPHPKEPGEHYESLKKKYPLTVMKLSPPQVFSYDAINASDALLSPTSMCLYEALAFGKPAFSMQRFEGVTVAEHLEFVESTEDFYHSLVQKSKESGEGVKREYLTGFRPDVLDKFLN